MATSAAADQIVEVVTPAAGESVSEGTILEWHAKVGDFIKASDTIVEISTDKVDVELPAPASGTRHANGPATAAGAASAPPPTAGGGGAEPAGAAAPGVEPMRGGA